jgi:hypothetical protein
MALDRSAEIADAIVAYLPTKQYRDLTVTAPLIKRVRLSIEELADVGEQHEVIVRPQLIEYGTSSRAGGQRDYMIDIYVLKAIPDSDPALQDQLAVLTEDIMHNLESQPMAAAPWAGFTAQSAFNPVTDQQMLAYLGMITGRYREVRKFAEPVPAAGMTRASARRSLGS